MVRTGSATARDVASKATMKVSIHSVAMAVYSHGPALKCISSSSVWIGVSDDEVVAAPLGSIDRRLIPAIWVLLDMFSLTVADLSFRSYQKCFDSEGRKVLEELLQKGGEEEE